MWQIGISPMKVARTENEPSFTQQQQSDDSQPITSTVRLRPGAHVIAACSGTHICATLSAMSDTDRTRVVRLEVWRSANASPSAIGTGTGRCFDSNVILPTSFFANSAAPLEAGEPQPAPVLRAFLGEGTDGASVVICDAFGNAGTVSIPSAGKQQQQQQQMQGHVYLHAHPLPVGPPSLRDVITAFSCVNGVLFFGTTAGTVAAIRTIDRESADRWVAVTASAHQTLLDQQLQNHNHNHNHNHNQQQQQSWFSRMIFGSTPSEAVQVARAPTTPPVTRVFPSRKLCFDDENGAGAGAGAWFSAHAGGLVVYHGAFDWQWQAPGIEQHSSAPPQIVAVSDSPAPDDNAVYVVYTAGAGAFFLAVLVLDPANYASATAGRCDILELELPRPLCADDFSDDAASATVAEVCPLRLHCERRALFVTPQFACAYTVAVGPRSPHNEVTVLESNRYISAARVRTELDAQQLVLVSGGAARSYPLADVFSAADREGDRAMLDAILRGEVSKDDALLQASEQIACATEANPWNWTRGGGGNPENQNANASSDLSRAIREDMNLLTFISNTLAKRATAHQLFLKRWQAHTLWNEVADETRATLHEHHIGLAMLVAIRKVQNECVVHRALASAFETLAHSEFDRVRVTGEVFAALIPRAARHPKCCRPPLASLDGFSDAEIVFGHPRNAAVLLFEAAQMLRDLVRSVSSGDNAAPDQKKLMWACVIGSMWHFAAAAAQSFRGTVDRLWVLQDNEWLDTAMPIVVQACSDAVALATDSLAAEQQQHQQNLSTLPPQQERVQTALIDVIADLLTAMLELHTQGRAIADGALRAALLREPFLKRTYFGYPYESSQQQQQQQSMGGPEPSPAAGATGAAAVRKAEHIAIQHNVLPTLFDMCSAVDLLCDGAAANRRQVALQQRFRAYTERVPDFFEFACERLLEQNREMELGCVHKVVQRTPVDTVERTRAAVLADRSPSALWTLLPVVSSASEQGEVAASSKNIVDAVVASGYEQRPAVPLAAHANAAAHRAISASLAKLAWAADGRTVRHGRKVDIEAKIAAAQKNFLSASDGGSSGGGGGGGGERTYQHNKALSHTEVTRALLSMKTEPGRNLVVACELADCLPHDDPARMALLREVLRACFAYEGQRLIDVVVRNQSIGDQERLRQLNESLTAKTLAKSNDLLLLCAAPNDPTIASTTSAEFAGMLHQWRLLNEN